MGADDIEKRSVLGLPDAETDKLAETIHQYITWAMGADGMKSLPKIVPDKKAGKVKE